MVGDAESRERVFHRSSISLPMSFAKSFSIAVMSVLLIHRLLSLASLEAV